MRKFYLLMLVACLINLAMPAMAQDERPEGQLTADLYVNLTEHVTLSGYSTLPVPGGIGNVVESADGSLWVNGIFAGADLYELNIWVQMQPTATAGTYSLKNKSLLWEGGEDAYVQVLTVDEESNALVADEDAAADILFSWQDGKLAQVTDVIIGLMARGQYYSASSNVVMDPITEPHTVVPADMAVSNGVFGFYDFIEEEDAQIDVQLIATGDALYMGFDGEPYGAETSDLVWVRADVADGQLVFDGLQWLGHDDAHATHMFFGPAELSEEWNDEWEWYDEIPYFLTEPMSMEFDEELEAYAAGDDSHLALSSDKVGTEYYMVFSQPWIKDFGTVSGIDAVNGDKAAATQIYDITGRRLNGLQKGLNIVRAANGSTSKIMVK